MNEAARRGGRTMGRSTVGLWWSVWLVVVALWLWPQPPAWAKSLAIYQNQQAACQPPFNDIPCTHWARGDIEQILAAGITVGCGGGNYCPLHPVTREQMAIFLLRGIHGGGYTSPAATGARFADVPASHWAAAWIERLAATGITIGCGGGNYCPNTPLTRAQMAIFLLRAKHGSDYQPPSATGARFGDVPASHWAAAWIEQLAQEGITGGCGGGNYCPDAAVNRDQMAAFLVRTFSLGEKFRLAIRPFGSGDVRATIQSSALPGGGMIEWCGTLPAQSDCHYDLPEGASVRLLPEAAPGWVFSHWLGCDRIENTECVLVMRDDHRTVAPTFDSPREVTLQSDVVMLSAETVALLEGETESTLTFAAGATLRACSPAR